MRSGFTRAALRRALLVMSMSLIGAHAVGAAAATAGQKSKPPRKAVVKKAVVGKTAARVAPDYLQRPDVLAYIDNLVEREHLDRDALMRVFADVHYSETAARLMSPSLSTGVRRDWNVYRARFIEPVRLAAGFRFWDDNAELLARAERDFGVPAEIIVGILGVETVYGRNTGSFRAIDVLTTLAFDYPNKERDRSSFFREQLTDALIMSRDRGVDALTLRGSYAGAIGMPQFMPGSILSDAIDYDGDGRIDLVGSPADIIGSVANFLARRGWVRDLETHVSLSHGASSDVMQLAAIAAMVDAGSKPRYGLSDITDAGFVAASLPSGAKLALIDLPSGTDARGAPLTSYLAGTQNFHVITQYNRSYFYAFSVIELGSTIKALRDARLP
jgi:membrane-bound lytic murein transglycosylase B